MDWEAHGECEREKHAGWEWPPKRSLMPPSLWAAVLSNGLWGTRM